MAHAEVERMREQLESYIEQHDHSSLDPDDWQSGTPEEEGSAVVPPHEMLGADIDVFVRFADTLITHDVLSPRRAVIHAVSNLTHNSDVSASALLDAPRSTIDSTRSQSRSALKSGFFGHILQNDTYWEPLEIDYRWKRADTNDPNVIHPPGTYHLFTHSPPEGNLDRWNTHQFTLIAETLHPMPQSHKERGIQDIEFERFYSTDELREYLYDDVHFWQLDEAEHWRHFLEDLPIEVTPQSVPIERIKPQILPAYFDNPTVDTSEIEPTDLPNYDADAFEEYEGM